MTAVEGSDLRRRAAVKTDTAAASSSSTRAGKKSTADDEPIITLVDFFRILGGVVLVNCLLSYLYTGGTSLIWGAPRPWWTKPAEIQRWRVRSKRTA